MAVDVTQIIDPAKQLVEPIATTLSDTWAAVIGDRVAAWRLKNAAALQIRVNEQVAKLGLQLDRSRIPERYAFAWFDEATKQDEPEIQELFARLLARAAAGEEHAFDRRHLETISRFTPMDAQVFEALFGPRRIAGEPSWDEYDVWKTLKEEIGADAELSLEHLIALGLLERTYNITHDRSIGGFRDTEEIGRDFMKKITSALSIIAELEQTVLGTSLYIACAPIGSATASEQGK